MRLVASGRLSTGAAPLAYGRPSQLRATPPRYVVLHIGTAASCASGVGTSARCAFGLGSSIGCSGIVCIWLGSVPTSIRSFARACGWRQFPLELASTTLQSTNYVYGRGPIHRRAISLLPTGHYLVAHPRRLIALPSGRPRWGGGEVIPTTVSRKLARGRCTGQCDDRRQSYAIIFGFGRQLALADVALDPTGAVAWLSSSPWQPRIRARSLLSVF